MLRDAKESFREGQANNTTNYYGGGRLRWASTRPETLPGKTAVGGREPNRRRATGSSVKAGGALGLKEFMHRTRVLGLYRGILKVWAGSTALVWDTPSPCGIVMDHSATVTEWSANTRYCFTANSAIIVKVLNAVFGLSSHTPSPPKCYTMLRQSSHARLFAHSSEDGASRLATRNETAPCKAKFIFFTLDMVFLSRVPRVYVAHGEHEGRPTSYAHGPAKTLTHYVYYDRFTEVPIDNYRWNNG